MSQEEALLKSIYLAVAEKEFEIGFQIIIVGRELKKAVENIYPQLRVNVEDEKVYLISKHGIEERKD